MRLHRLTLQTLRVPSSAPESYCKRYWVAVESELQHNDCTRALASFIVGTDQDSMLQTKSEAKGDWQMFERPKDHSGQRDSLPRRWASGKVFVYPIQLALNNVPKILKHH